MLYKIQDRTLRMAVIATLGIGVSSAQNFGPQDQAAGPPRPENVAAKVMEMRGRVSVMRGSSPWILSVGDPVGQRETVLTGPDGWAIFQVNDGSTFEVFPNSRVIFRANFNPEDLLDVILGRIKVHVQRWGGRPNPNRIHTPTAVISVRGTTFDVAVEEDESTLVAVEEGQVGVRHRQMPGGTERLLNGGDEITVYKNVPLAKVRIDKGNIAQRGANALAEVFYTIVMRSPRGGGSTPLPGGGGPGGGAPLPGDTGAEPPPPPPPDSAPPPPQ